MKNYIMIVLLTLLTTSAHAGSAGWLNLVCTSEKALNGGYPQRVELTQLNNDAIREGVLIPFQLSVKDIRPIYQEVLVHPRIFKGKLSTEDVVVSYESDDGTISFGAYMDEMDQSYIVIRGQQLSLKCENPN